MSEGDIPENNISVKMMEIIIQRSNFWTVGEY